MAQTGKKTRFRVLAGPAYITKTNLTNFSMGTGWGVYNRYEKATVGISVQAMASFYLAKSLRLNTGIVLDTKGFTAKGSGPGPNDGPVSYQYQVTGGYLGIPLSLEASLLSHKKFQLSIDAGLLEQWKIFSSKNGTDLAKNQLSLTGGFYGSLAASGRKILLHPLFRYGLNPFQGPLIGGPSPNYHAISIGLELGYQF